MFWKVLDYKICSGLGVEKKLGWKEITQKLGVDQPKIHSTRLRLAKYV